MELHVRAQSVVRLERIVNPRFTTKMSWRPIADVPRDRRLAEAREVARLCYLAPGERTMHARRLSGMNGTPVTLSEACVLGHLCKQVTAASLRKQALSEVLLAHGVKFGRVIQEMTVEVSDSIRAKLMQTEVGVPLLEILCVIQDPDSTPVQFISVTTTPGRSRTLMDILGDTVNTVGAGQFVHEVAHKTPS